MSDVDRPAIELLPEDDASGRVESGTDEAALHARVRSACAVAAVAILFWIGLSVAGSRAADEQMVCFYEVQFGTITRGLADEPDVGGRLAERAETCGLPTLADHIRARYEEADGG